MRLTADSDPWWGWQWDKTNPLNGNHDRLGRLTQHEYRGEAELLSQLVVFIGKIQLRCILYFYIIEPDARIDLMFRV